MKKYCVAIISMILAVSLCSCGAGGRGAGEYDGAFHYSYGIANT